MSRFLGRLACYTIGPPRWYVILRQQGDRISPCAVGSATNNVGTVLGHFGGNPLAVAVGHAVVGLLETGEFQERARVLGERLRSRLEPLVGSRGVTEVRTVGLWAGVDLDPAVLSGRQAAEGLAQRGVLAKETHDITIRFAPPLIITEEELDWMLDQFEAVLDAATTAH